MWTKLVGVLMVGMLLSLLIGQQVVQGVQASVQAREVINGQVSRILADGDARDEIPVIITLQNAEFARSLSTNSISRQQRISTVRTIQRNFASRNAMRIQVMERQPQYHPVMFVKMRRQDVATVAADSAVIGIKQDKPVPVLMDESTIIIGSVDANAAGHDGTGMSVAVLDTGVKTDHEFLDGQVVAESCFSNIWGDGTSLCPSGTSTTNAVSNDVGSAAPCVGYSGCDHGTHVAGTVAGKVVNKGAYTLRGVAPGAKIIGIQVFTYFADSDPDPDIDNSGIGSWTADQIDAMDWLIANMSTPSWGTLASLNMSLGGGESATTCDASSVSLKSYIDDLRTLGVATVIASGNDGWSDKIASPACISSAIAVGSTSTSAAVTYGLATAVDQVSSFSNAPTSANNGINGNGDRLLDLLAPGSLIWSATTSSTTTYQYKQGTSMATPHVAGAWAVMKQAAPTASVAQILQWLNSTGTSITDTRNSLVLPRINVDDAVNAALSPDAFAKAGLANNSRNQPLTVTAAWGASSGASRYEYCLANTAAACSRWTNVRTARSVVLRNLASGRTYYWNVRAVNANGATLSNGSAWRFTTTTQALPRAFAKIAPANRLANRPLNTALTWNASAGAARYEYCLAASAAACTNWRSVGTARSVTVRSLARNRTYFWQVRAVNTAGQTVSVGGVWRFSTIR